jgi:hypothetical protein
MVAVERRLPTRGDGETISGATCGTSVLIGRLRCERFCHASQSLLMPVPVEPNLRLNGEDVPFDARA